MAPVTDDLARFDARLNEQIAQDARSWLAYLETRQSLMELEASAGEVAFELAESRESEVDGLRSRIAALLPATRARFEAVVERETQDTQAELERTNTASSTEPDAALHQALERLLADASGANNEEGEALVPFGPADDVRWYAVDRAALEGPPDASQYAAGTPIERQRIRRTLMLAIPLLVVALVWIVLPRGARHASVTDAVLVNGTPMPAWSVVAADLQTASGVEHINLAPIDQPPWTVAVHDAGAWARHSIAPLRMCLPADVLARTTTLTLTAQAGLPGRRFVLTEGGAPDLLLDGCDRASLQRSAIFEGVVERPDQPFGTAVPLSDEQSLTVMGIGITGRGERPDLPDGQALITVHVRAPAALDWPALAPTLLLPSGAALLPSETQALTDSIAFQYLAPEPRHPLDVAWTVTEPTHHAVLRWRTTLAVPPGRDAVLRAALDVRSVTAERDQAGVIHVAVQIANTGTSVLSLSPEELTILRQERAVAYADEQALAVLAPGETRTLSLATPEALPLVVAAGPNRMAIEEGGSTER